jgi:hypothetical protein
MLWNWNEAQSIVLRREMLYIRLISHFVDIACKSALVKIKIKIKARINKVR